MGADFSGYATKSGLKCSDGLTIGSQAFRHMDGERVPLLWQHGHQDPENVLGHVELESRSDGVYAHGFFNETPRGQHARKMIEHGDIKSMSIYANHLKKSSDLVEHGTIREVSLVLAGANPGALIDFVSIRHSDGELEDLSDEAVIYTNDELELTHAEDDDEEDTEDTEDDDDDETVQDIYDTFDDKQKKVVQYLIGAALEDSDSDEVKQSDLSHVDAEDATVKEVYDAFTPEQKNVVHYLIGLAVEEAEEETIKQYDTSSTDSEGSTMGNVFDRNASTDVIKHTVTLDDVKAIVSDAQEGGSFKKALGDYALKHGITDVDTLFPDAKAISGQPEFLSRRMEWVTNVMGAVKHNPFSRLKTLAADITQDEARAKGYIKGNLKKEEFFKVVKRVTTPKTIYKKQALDRDDILDVTDFDMVAWLMAEMRIMLDEEIAVAILIGDGREIDDEDKIDEEHVRPVAKDDDFYATKINVNLNDAGSNADEIVDVVMANRRHYRGSGSPTFYTTETIISNLLSLKDTLGRRLYSTLQEVAGVMRVKDIIAVEAMEREPNLVGIIVNLADYSVGADRGGQITTMNDFDIDYNKNKYLIETRISGALTKPKSALVITKTVASAVLAEPTKPAFNQSTNVITIPSANSTGVQYKLNGTNVSPGALPAITADATVTATPKNGFYFESSEGDEWKFTFKA